MKVPIKARLYRMTKHKYELECCRCGRPITTIKDYLPNTTLYEMITFCSYDCLTDEIYRHIKEGGAF